MRTKKASRNRTRHQARKVGWCFPWDEAHCTCGHVFIAHDYAGYCGTCIATQPQISVNPCYSSLTRSKIDQHVWGGKRFRIK
jgi:hypothetical protein